MANEEIGKYFDEISINGIESVHNTIFKEPLWKRILGNKSLLPLLWSMYPNHPNLLSAYY